MLCTTWICSKMHIQNLQHLPIVGGGGSSVFRGGMRPWLCHWVVGGCTWQTAMLFSTPAKLDTSIRHSKRFKQCIDILWFILILPPLLPTRIHLWSNFLFRLAASGRLYLGPVFWQHQHHFHYLTFHKIIYIHC